MIIYYVYILDQIYMLKAYTINDIYFRSIGAILFHIRNKKMGTLTPFQQVGLLIMPKYWPSIYTRSSNWTCYRFNISRRYLTCWYLKWSLHKFVLMQSALNFLVDWIEAVCCKVTRGFKFGTPISLLSFVYSVITYVIRFWKKKKEHN